MRVAVLPDAAVDTEDVTDAKADADSRIGEGEHESA